MWRSELEDGWGGALRWPWVRRSWWAVSPGPRKVSEERKRRPHIAMTRPDCGIGHELTFADDLLTRRPDRALTVQPMISGPLGQREYAGRAAKPSACVHPNIAIARALRRKRKAGRRPPGAGHRDASCAQEAARPRWWARNLGSFRSCCYQI